MHILILVAVAGAREKMPAALGDVADRYTIVTTWAEVLAALKADRPDLLLVERIALAQVELAMLSDLGKPGCWPPLLLVDAPATDAGEGIAAARWLAQAAHRDYQIGELYIDTRKKRVRLGERWVTLPPIQYHLLLALAQRSGEVVGSRELLQAVWGYDAREHEARELIKVHIRQIRRRLGLDPEKYPYIRSVRGFGYMLAPPDEE